MKFSNGPKVSTRFPLVFEKNTSNLDEKVKFLARANDYVAFFTNDELIINTLCKNTKSDLLEKDENTLVEYLKMKFYDVCDEVEIYGEDVKCLKVNYFLGKDKNKWRENIELYSKVNYKNIYKNVDLVYYSCDGFLEYDFILRPGGNLDDIAMSFLGEYDYKLNEDGELLIYISSGIIKLLRPSVYQMVNRKRKEVDCKYAIDDKKVIRFSIDKYDETKELIIDPILVYSSYLGGDDNDRCTDLVVDKNGYIYITGVTQSANFPVINGQINGKSDVFITKFNSTGTDIIYSTFLGGSDEEFGNAIKVDEDGAVYIVGETRSNDFPTTEGAYCKMLSGTNNAFITKLDSSGTISYSTYLGGSDRDFALGVDIDDDKNAYIVGVTSSKDFPITEEAYSGKIGGSTDIFITKIDNKGEGLIYSTFLGGSDIDEGIDIKVDKNKNAYIVGCTKSTNFPTTFNGLLRGKSDGFIVKLNQYGSRIKFSRYLGGFGEDTINSICLGDDGYIYVCGRTDSEDFPTTENCYSGEYSFGGSNGFVCKLDSRGYIIASTYLGDDMTICRRIIVDKYGRVHIVGTTKSDRFPTTINAYSNSFSGGTDVFLSIMDKELKKITYSSYLGGSIDEVTSSLDIDNQGNIYIAGYTNSPDFPTTKGAYDIICNGLDDIFISKFTFKSKVNTIMIATPNKVTIGGVIVYNIKVNNLGPDIADNLEVSVKLDSKVSLISYNSTNGSVEYVDENIVFRLDEINVDSSEIITIVGIVGETKEIKTSYEIIAKSSNIELETINGEIITEVMSFNSTNNSITKEMANDQMQAIEKLNNEVASIRSEIIKLITSITKIDDDVINVDEILTNQNNVLSEIDKEIKIIQDNFKDINYEDTTNALTTGPVVRDSRAGSMVIVIKNTLETDETIEIHEYDLTSDEKNYCKRVMLIEANCSRAYLLPSPTSIYQLTLKPLKEGIFIWTSTRVQPYGDNSVENSTFIASNTFAHEDLSPVKM